MTTGLKFIGLIFSVFLLAAAVSAQEMRIYTTIRDQSAVAANAQGGKARIVVSSLMLFHSGKIYDYIDPAQEVTVFEPSLRRFTILDIRREVCSELTQDEIRQFLGLAEDAAYKLLATLSEDESEISRKSIELLRFQLQPDFTTQFEASKTKLTLADGKFHYIVDGDQTSSAEVLEKYLHVADWTAQLNSVLHPQSLLPAPRLMLNRELKSRGIRPLTVMLKAETEPPLHLTAQHQWKTSLETKDRQMIEAWEKQLRDPKLRRIPFRQLQQETLKSEVAKRR